MGEYFGQLLSNGRVLRGSSLNSAVSHCNFWAQTFHKVV